MNNFHEVLRLDCLLLAAESRPDKQYNPSVHKGRINVHHFDFEAYLAENIVTELRRLGVDRNYEIYDKRIARVYQKSATYEPPLGRPGWGG